MHCTICNTPHHITVQHGRDEPLIFTACDQNFPGNVGGGGGNCIRSVRVEDGSLPEITELLMDVLNTFGGVPSNTIILLGSASHLLRSGSSGYVMEWLDSAARLTQRWNSVRVCPLVPILLENSPGTLFRSICETSAAFDLLFGTDPRGLADTWRTAVNLCKLQLQLAADATHTECYTLFRSA